MTNKLVFKKAKKYQAKLRLAMYGTAGSGKTYSSLRIATGMLDILKNEGNGRIAVIDTERGSAAKYAGKFDFDVLELPNHRLNTYINAMDAAEEAGYPILIIDSLSHGWERLLQTIDDLAKSKFGGNKWAAWSEGTPAQRKFIDNLLNYDGHTIGTMRVKTEWELQRDEKGKVKPIRLGLEPRQGKQIEFEFDLLMQIFPNHYAEVLKDRTGKYQDEIIEEPDEDFGRDLAEWLQEGEPTPKPEPEPEPTPEPEPASTPQPQPETSPEPQPDQPQDDHGYGDLTNKDGKRLADMTVPELAEYLNGITNYLARKDLKDKTRAMAETRQNAAKFYIDQKKAQNEPEMP